jgi:hypothetical protein
MKHGSKQSKNISEHYTHRTILTVVLYTWEKLKFQEFENKTQRKCVDLKQWMEQMNLHSEHRTMRTLQVLLE